MAQSEDITERVRASHKRRVAEDIREGKREPVVRVVEANGIIRRDESLIPREERKGE